MFFRISSSIRSFFSQHFCQIRSYFHKRLGTMALLSAEERENVRTYKYHGGDSSPIYKYILSPFAQFCIDYLTPRSVAPNMITLTGLFVSVIAAVLTLVYNPNLTLHGPRWLHLVTGISIFAYQTLDNMDGKQARRTGSSSALGMLFDHGCDAINAGVTAISMGSVLATGWTVKLFFPIACAFIPFYFQTWEEYYLGAMILPAFNGPTEGLLMCVTVCIFSFANGSEWFQQAPIHLPEYLLFDSQVLEWLHVPTRSHPLITPLSIAFLFGYGATYITAIVQTITVLYKISIKKKKSIVQPLLDLLPFLIFFPSVMFWCEHSKVALVMHPLATMLLMNSIFVDMVTHLMLQHICKGKVKPFERYGAFIMGLYPIYIIYKPTHFSPSIEAWSIFILAAFFSVKLSITIARVCTEVSEVLDIFVLKLGKRHPHAK